MHRLITISSKAIWPPGGATSVTPAGVRALEVVVLQIGVELALKRRVHQSPWTVGLQTGNTSGALVRATADRKFPNLLRIVFSLGVIPVTVHSELLQKGSERGQRLLVTIVGGVAQFVRGPSNTPGGFVLWELRSTG